MLFNLDGAGSDENKSYRAAMTLRAIQETDMFELFSSQMENKKLIEELMEKYVDEEGNALPLKKERNVSKPVADWRKLVWKDNVCHARKILYALKRTGFFYHVQRGVSWIWPALPPISFSIHFT